MQLNNLDLNMLKQLNVKELKNIMLSNLNVGDVFKAQVLNINNNAMTLRLPDGSVINASSLIQFNINIGDLLDLEVHEKNDNQTFVRVINEKAPQVENFAKLEVKLNKLDIPINEKNLYIAKQIEQNNLVFSKENFNKLLSSSNEGSIDKAVFLAANNISDTEININMIDDLVNGKNTLSDNLLKLNELINNVRLKNVQGQKLEQVISILQKAVNSVINDKIMSLDNAEGKLINNTEASTSIIANTDKNINSESSIESTNISSKETINIDNGIKQNTLSLEKNIINNISKNILLSQDKEINMERNDIEGKNVINNKENSELNLKNLIKNLFVNIRKDDYEGLKEELNIKSLYTKILDVSKTLKASLIDSGIENNDEIVKTLNNIEKDISFITQLTKFNSYFHIPININGYESTAELYIFKDNKSGKNINPDDSSLFISLDTHNLGTVESYIKVKNKSSVECTFRNTNKKVLDTIRTYGIKLYKLLEAYGYKLIKIDYKVIDKKDKCNVINCREIKNKLERKYSIDFKV